MIPDVEWNAFMKACTNLPPFSCRIVESFMLCPSHIDTVPGVPSQGHELMQYMKSKHVDTVNKMTVDAKTHVKLDPLPW